MSRCGARHTLRSPPADPLPLPPPPPPPPAGLVPFPPGPPHPLRAVLRNAPFPAPRPLRALGRAHLDRAVAAPRLERGLREGGRALLDRAVLEPELAAVPRALHAVADELALVERPPAVHARVREREHLSPAAHDEDRHAVDVDRAHLALADRGVGQHGRPVLRVVLERREAHAHALGVG